MKGYVYSLWSGRLLIKEATIVNYPDDSRNAGLAYAKFITGPGIELNQNPRKIHNAIVWLEERCDNVAIDLLIEYQDKQIAKLQEKIDNYKHKIKILQESKEDN